MKLKAIIITLLMIYPLSSFAEIEVLAAEATALATLNDLKADFITSNPELYLKQSFRLSYNMVSRTRKEKFNNIILKKTSLLEINGHKLPPFPDETVNNSSLLGIDSNNNGVRDDVERWIFQEYKHPIVQALAMQNARAFGLILVDPLKAKETKKFTDAVMECESYYIHQDSRRLIPKGTYLHKESRPFIINTSLRSHAYYQYNEALSGGVYSLGDWDKYKESCDFNETKIERGEW